MDNTQGTIDDTVVENSNNLVVPLLNPIIAEEEEDFLYHFGISKTKDNIPATFGDVKFVCTGGSGPRLASFAETFSKEIRVPCSDNLSRSDRFIMYKTGPVLRVNHGMGNPSISIMLVEVIKLLHYAGASDVTAFRLGTSGGVAVEPGTVVLSTSALNGELQEYHIQYILGKKGEYILYIHVLHPTPLNHSLTEELADLAKKVNVPVECGKTMCADDFYEGGITAPSFPSETLQAALGFDAVVFLVCLIVYYVFRRRRHHYSDDYGPTLDHIIHDEVNKQEQEEFLTAQDLRKIARNMAETTRTP